MLNVIVVVSIEFRRIRFEKSCNFICLSSINKVLLLLLHASVNFNKKEQDLMRLNSQEDSMAEDEAALN
jgi:hypothetical protein